MSNKIDKDMLSTWVHNNPLKYHMYTKIPLVLFVLYVIMEINN